jgi:hypothetical protein
VKKPLTIRDIRQATYELRIRNTPCGIVRTREQANDMNEFDSILGIRSNWKVEDIYYEMRIHPKTLALFLRKRKSMKKKPKGRKC